MKMVQTPSQSGSTYQRERAIALGELRQQSLAAQQELGPNFVGPPSPIATRDNTGTNFD